MISSELKFKSNKRQAAETEPIIVLEKRRRNIIPIETKMEIIQKAKSQNKPTGELAIEYDLPASTISTIIHPDNVAKLEKMLANRRLDDLNTHVKFPYYPDIEEALDEWLKEARANNIRINGGEIKEKALFFAGKFNHTDFKASNGWLSNYKKRHSVVFASSLDEVNQIKGSKLTANGDIFIKEEETFDDDYEDEDDDVDEVTSETNINGAEGNDESKQQQQRQFRRRGRGKTKSSTLAASLNHMSEIEDQTNDEFLYASIWQIDPVEWTCEDVCEFVSNIVAPEIVHAFKWHEIDGVALDYLRAESLVATLAIKLGPAAKIKRYFDKAKLEFSQSKHKSEDSS